MKNLKFAIIACILVLSSCDNESKNVTDVEQLVFGNESELPDELKGLKVYGISSNSGYFKVAVMNKNVNSIGYASGKTQESIMIVDKCNNKLIEVKQVLMENDSLIICRK